MFKNQIPSVALQNAETCGKRLEKAYNRVLCSMTTKGKIKVIRSADVFGLLKCQNITNCLVGYYELDSVFKQDVHSQLFTNIAGKIALWKQTVSGDAYIKGLSVLSRFLLEEIAVTVYLREVEDYKVEVYPSLPMALVEKIYTNEYPELTAQLKLSTENYGYINLNIEVSRES